MQDELSTYADEVFETASEADLKQPDESELTGSALDKSVLERSHLMLWVDILYCIIYIQRTLLLSVTDRSPTSPSTQPLRARMEES